MSRKWWKICFKILRDKSLWLSPHFLCVAILMLSGGLVRATLEDIIIRFVMLAIYVAFLVFIATCHLLRKNILEEEKLRLQEELNLLQNDLQQRILKLRESILEEDESPATGPQNPWFLGGWQEEIKMEK